MESVARLPAYGESPTKICVLTLPVTRSRTFTVVIKNLLGPSGVGAGDTGGEFEVHLRSSTLLPRFREDCGRLALDRIAIHRVTVSEASSH
jgi:hypothetical protein